MNKEKEWREESKKYIDEADGATLEIVCAMPEAKQEYKADWWDELPVCVQQEIDEAIKEFTHNFSCIFDAFAFQKNTCNSFSFTATKASLSASQVGH
jgi:hypothetical protein